MYLVYCIYGDVRNICHDKFEKRRSEGSRCKRPLIGAKFETLICLEALTLPKMLGELDMVAVSFVPQRKVNQQMSTLVKTRGGPPTVFKPSGYCIRTYRMGIREQSNSVSQHHPWPNIAKRFIMNVIHIMTLCRTSHKIALHYIPTKMIAPCITPALDVPRKCQALWRFGRASLSQPSKRPQEKKGDTHDRLQYRLPPRVKSSTCTKQRCSFVTRRRLQPGCVMRSSFPSLVTPFRPWRHASSNFPAPEVERANSRACASNVQICRRRPLSRRPWVKWGPGGGSLGLQNQVVNWSQIFQPFCRVKHKGILKG